MRITVAARDAKCKRLRQWHKKFIFFPKFINNEHQLLCYVARKYTGDNSYAFGRLGLYDYKDLQQFITDKLMSKEK